jgi:purine nucleosidase
MIRMVIDTDPGVDDAHAIMMAAAHPNVQIEAITTVAGNVSLEKGTVNALRILDVLDLDVPVYAGADRALVVPAPSRATSHGGDGLGDCGYPISQRQPQDEHAVLALIRLAKEFPGELTLVALGPLTNLALAARLDPTFPQAIKKLVIMGGAVHGKGNSWRPAAEFNFYIDPDAAHIVLQAWPHATLAPWEVAVQAALPNDAVDALGSIDSPLARFYASTVVTRFGKQIDGVDLLFEADGTAMAAAIEPDIVTSKSLKYVEVELVGKLARGESVVDWYDLLEKKPNVDIVLEINQERFFELLQMACGASAESLRG